MDAQRKTLRSTGKYAIRTWGPKKAPLQKTIGVPRPLK